MANLGIELLDLRLKRLNYVEQVQKDVFARMIAERNRVADCSVRKVKAKRRASAASGNAN